MQEAVDVSEEMSVPKATAAEVLYVRKEGQYSTPSFTIKHNCPIMVWNNIFESFLCFLILYFLLMELLKFYFVSIGTRYFFIIF